MTNFQATETSLSSDCNSDPQPNQQTFALRSAKIGRGTLIKRALPSRQKRMIGAWCFLDHAGPVTFESGQGLDIGPHPHTGLQTFTWMIEGSMMHHDSLGSAQLIQPNQVNLMTAGYGISHTEVVPAAETRMHSVQLWIALPDDKKDMPPQFEHYPDLPVVDQDQIRFTVLVGKFLGACSPVQVHSPLLGVDLQTELQAQTTIALNSGFEYGLLVLQGRAMVNGQSVDDQQLLVLSPGESQMQLQLEANSRVILVGGEPFETPILLWWNFVARSQEEMLQAREQWINQDARFGEIPEYAGERMSVPMLPDRMRPSQ